MQASPQPLLGKDRNPRRPQTAKRGWNHAQPFGKRACRQADVGRAGSVESACTHFGACTAAAVGGAAAAGNDGAERWGADSIGATAQQQLLWLSSGTQASAQSQHALASLSATSPAATSQPAAAAAPAATAAADAGAAKHVAVVQRGNHATAAAAASCDEFDPAELVTKAYCAELAAANETLKRLPLPGSQQFWPVHHSCAMLPLCAAYEVSPAGVALGASYFQRLLAAVEELGSHAIRCGFFSLQQQPGAPAGCQEWVMHAQPCCEYLNSLLCTCIYLGAKMTEGTRYQRQLSRMLGHVLHRKVSTDQAAEVELCCLQKLGWRLGPYRCANSPP